MLIGEVAESAGLPSQTIRFYEREGLLPPAGRGNNGYRVYDETALNRLGFIRAAQSAGLTLAEIRSILDVRDAGDVPCGHVTALLQARLAAVGARMRELETLTSELEHLLERSQRLDPGNCTDTDVCHILSVSEAAGEASRGELGTRLESHLDEKCGDEAALAVTLARAAASRIRTFP